MRDIVFRAKRLDNGEWVEGYYGKKQIPVIQHYIMKSELLNYSDCQYFVDYEVDPETVGECTWLKDKNGKMIFEGDILRKKGFWNLRIEYENGVCWVRDTDTVRFINRVLNTPISEFAICDFEIIGNVFDNPELLNN